jgi:hypothetical protein
MATALAAEDVHDHYWDFSSLILRGRLRIEHYEASLNRQDQQYSVRELADFGTHASGVRSYDFRDAGVQGLRRTSTVELGMGAVHSLRAGGVHRVSRSANEPTATLVLQGPPVSSSTRVFFPTSTHSKDYEHRRHSRPVTLQEFEEVLEHLRRRSPVVDDKGIGRPPGATDGR